MSTTYYLTPNDKDSNGVYQGSTFVFDTSGGFAVEQSFAEINLNTFSPIAQYDVTDAIQIRFSVRTMNNKIGIIKDQSNVEVLQVLYYNNLQDVLEDVHGNVTDNVTVSSGDFLKGVTTENIVSMGKMDLLYSNFNYTVMEYFGAPYGFSTIFAGASEYNINEGKFGKTEFIKLINGISFDGVTGNVISDFTGYFTVNDLNKHLRFICGTNVFGNRSTRILSVSQDVFGIYSPSSEFSSSFSSAVLGILPTGSTLSVTETTINGSNGVKMRYNVTAPQLGSSIITFIEQNIDAINTSLQSTFPNAIVQGQLTDNTNIQSTGNYGLTDGFIAGDLIYIPNGMSITLSVAIEPEPYTPINNVGPTNLDSVDEIVNYSDPQRNIHRVTTSTLTNITQTYSVPILIILDNIDKFNFDNYGDNWVNIGNDLGYQQWISVCISSLGDYQSAITEQGDIYVSDNYGTNWYLVFNIGPSPIASIGVSQTGEYQTVSTGSKIFISSNFGFSWFPVIPDNGSLVASPDFDTYTMDVPNVGTSNVFVGVSLGGKYQTILSCGDSIYRSANYGQNWTKLNGDEAAATVDTAQDAVDAAPNDSVARRNLEIAVSKLNLYNSIQSFPTGGVSLSFTGKYQTIACETIWLSSDYGETWIDVYADQPTNDHNWDGVSISSDGRIQSATDSGGYIYNSQDYGATWNIVTSNNRTWFSISISANANFQTAIDIAGYIFVSLDYGSTWALCKDTTTYGKSWQGVSCSANGQYQTAIEYNGSIWSSNLL